MEVLLQARISWRGAALCDRHTDVAGRPVLEGLSNSKHCVRSDSQSQARCLTAGSTKAGARCASEPD